MRLSRGALLGSILLLGLATGCSDDGGPVDSGPRPERRRDRGPEAALDLALDLPGDQGSDLAPGADAKPDVPGTPDKSLPDKPVGDGNIPFLSGYVTRTATPVGDGKGELYVGLYLAPFPIQMAGTQVTADLSVAGNKVKYEIWSAPPQGTYSLIAFLDDNGNATPFPFLVADPGDLTVSQPVAITVAASPKPQQLDLVLDKVEGVVAGDGGPDGQAKVGSLKGKVTASASPSGDGKGTLYVAVHSQLPPAGAMTSTLINNADLSSPYASETYFLTGLPPGNYYLYVYLDDNMNFNLFAPGPDKGDLIHGKPIQLHIVGGVMNTQDAVLDQAKP
jgi:uncharacterized protein (DUF2141 family)